MGKHSRRTSPAGKAAGIGAALGVAAALASSALIPTTAAAATTETKSGPLVVLHHSPAAARDDQVARINTALAEAVREAGRVTSGLVESEGPELHPEDPADPETSLHPVHRARRMQDERQRRRAHLRVVSDDEDAGFEEPAENPDDF